MLSSYSLVCCEVYEVDSFISGLAESCDSTHEIFPRQKLKEHAAVFRTPFQLLSFNLFLNRNESRIAAANTPVLYALALPDASRKSNKFSINRKNHESRRKSRKVR